MTTLILKLATAPRFDVFKRVGNGLKRVGKAVADFFAVVAEAKQMAREAQQRHMFVNE
jgi:hypothetical protein